jgi:serine/threonine protein kinase
VLISEYIEGELLSDFIKKFPGKRLNSYQALHLLYAMVKGVEQIHNLGEYHGDLHSENVIINKFGLEFDLKLLDLIFSNDSKSESRKEDIVDLIKVFYESFGGSKYYRNQPDAVKYLCCGLKPSLILGKFKNITQLRIHLENMCW